MSILEPGKKIAICSDHAGYELNSIVEGYLMSQGIEYEDFGTDSDASIREYARLSAGMWSLPSLHAPTIMPMCLCFPHVSSSPLSHSQLLTHSLQHPSTVVVTSVASPRFP